MTICRAVLAVVFAIWVVKSTAAEGKPSTTKEQQLPFEWSIPGRVQDEAGNPISGAFVATLPGSEKQISTTSDESGQFVLEMRSLHPIGVPFVVTSSDGALMSFVKAVNYYSPPRLNRVVLQPIKTVTVTVIDKSGVVQEGATVGAVAGHLVRLVDSAIADEQGQVTLKIPADAEIEWIYAYLDHSGLDYYENYVAFPTRERLALPANLTLTLAGNQTAKVRVVDSDEQPVAGVTVVPWTVQIKGKLSYLNFSGMSDFPITNEAGVAEFAWIPANLEGRVSFETQHARYHCPESPVFETENVELTFHVLRVATVRGRVTLADGSPVAGVHLQGEGRGNTNEYFRGYTVTRDDGTYEFDIFPDQRTIIAVADESYGATSHLDILLTEGLSRDGVDFVVNDGTLIRGEITLGDDHHPAVGDHATLIQSSEGTDLVRFSITDTKGFYRFRVGPGNYELLLPNQDAAQPIQITVKEEDEIIYDGHAERKDRVDIVGTVTDEAGTPLANCTVYGESIAARGHAGFRTKTDADGKLKSERWSDRMIVYAIHSEKLLAGFAEISEDSTEVAVKLAPATSVSGIVRTKNGEPVINARVLLNVGHPLVEVAASLNLQTTTDERGAYSFRGILPEASCHVAVYRADAHTDGPRFEVSNLEPITLDEIVVVDQAKP